MKIIISAEGVKRECSAPFKLCASIEDIRQICGQLSAALATWRKAGITYGWVDIVPPPPAHVEGKPRPWCEPLPTTPDTLTQHPRPFPMRSRNER